MREKAPDPGLQEIDAWHDWFLHAHEQRLNSASEFPDRHYVDAERAKITALAAAIRAKMRDDYLARTPKP